MGEFAAAAESVVTAESVALETPAETGTDATPESAPAADDTPASGPAVSDGSTEAPPAVAPAPTAASRDASGRFAGKSPGPPSTIPYSRFQEVTKTASQRAEEIKTLKERFGWIGDQEAPVFKQFWQAYKADPARAFLNELPLLLNSPKYGSRMRQALAEMIGERKAATAEPTPETEEPKPDFYQDDEQGRRTFFYSAEQQAKHRAWQATQQEKDLQPIKAFIEEQKQQQAFGRITAESKQYALNLVTPLKSSPYFEPHRDAIRTKFRQYTGLDDRGKPIPGFANAMEGNAALHRAYAEVLQEVVIPSLSSTDRRALAASLQQKTGASSPNPARPGLSTGGAKPPSTFAEAAERVLAGQR